GDLADLLSHEPWVGHGAMRGKVRAAYKQERGNRRPLTHSFPIDPARPRPRNAGETIVRPCWWGDPAVAAQWRQETERTMRATTMGSKDGGAEPPVRRSATGCRLVRRRPDRLGAHSLLLALSAALLAPRVAAASQVERLDDPGGSASARASIALCQSAAQKP